MMSLNRERNDAPVAAAKALVALSQRRRSPRVKLSYPRTQPQGGVTGHDMQNGQQLLHPSKCRSENNSEIRRT